METNFHSLITLILTASELPHVINIGDLYGFAYRRVCDIKSCTSLVEQYVLLYKGTVVIRAHHFLLPSLTTTDGQSFSVRL